MTTRPPKYTPAQYLDGIRTGDGAVLQSIFQEYYPGIRDFVSKNRGAPQDAEDLFMDALEALCRKTNGGLSDLSCAFYTYLYEICKRLWYKKLRAQKRDAGVTPEELLVFNDEEDPQEAIEAVERHKLFWEHFQRLSPDCQKVLELSLYENKNSEEIAAAMGYASPGYARKRKHDCRKQLEDSVKKDPRYNELRDDLA